MIKINYQPLGIDLNLEDYREKLEKIKTEPAPSFETEKADLDYIQEKIEKYKNYQNFILIGNGGSRTSAWAFYHSLSEEREEKKFEFLSSAEPESISRIREKYSPRDTLVLVISKSGDNINALEPLLLLADYPCLVITGGQDSPLRQIAEKKNWKIIVHPSVGGRYSGVTSCGLAPAGLMGLDIKEIYQGAKEGYEKYNYQQLVNDNDALKLALYFHALEEKGYTEIFSSIYSTHLFAFLPLIIQLIHESTGKGGKGQTIFGDYSPESQHHTNQRFFGGRQNIIGLFMGVEKTQKDFPLVVEESLGEISFKNYPLKKLAGILASDTMKFDQKGVLGNAITKKIPSVELIVDKIAAKSMGEFMVFWHYFTVYSALLRDQDPFDQPEVEDSKVISFDLRVGNK